MGSDAAAYDASVAAISRDIARKKRANRSAKLKQCKLDARREQWLSQVRNKDCMVTSRGAPAASSPPHVALSKKLDRTSKEEEEEEKHRVEVEPDGLSSHESEEGSPTHSSRMNGCANNSISSESSFGSSSRSFSNAEVEEDICEERGKYSEIRRRHGRPPASEKRTELEVEAAAAESFLGGLFSLLLGI
ncbi:unnamed protein product [Musa hybrid cultivar]